MRYLSLFSGIEAASVAWHPLGWECVGVAEVEPFPCKVLAHRFPDVPNLGDITKITREQVEALGHIDLIVGGFPCQDLSIAGKRKGLRDENGTVTRSGLFYSAMQIVEWIDPRWVMLENVPGLFSSNSGADFASVVGELAGCGFDVPKNKWRNAGVVAGPRGLVEWVTLDAQYVRTQTHPRAVPQRRRRVFLVRDSGNWANRPPLFLEPESLRGNSPPSRKTRKDVTGSLSSRPTGGGGLGTDFDLAVARCDTTGEGARLDGESCNFVAVQGSVIGRADHAGPAGAGYDESGACFTLTKTDVHAIAYPINTQIALRHEALGEGTGFGIADDGAPSYTLQAAHSHAVAYGIRTANTSNSGVGVQDEVTHTLDQGRGVAIGFVGDETPKATENVAGTMRSQQGGEGYGVMTSNMQVRRLTPLECERLQGFRDNWTNIPGASDTVRYKALGNSMAVNVMSYLGQKINDHH